MRSKEYGPSIRERIYEKKLTFKEAFALAPHASKDTMQKWIWAAFARENPIYD